ncbi:MAG: hypothetical protein AAF644_11445 [Pseudomonadota bacterium]|jgi:uncharacterized protein (DUF3820 family)
MNRDSVLKLDEIPMPCGLIGKDFHYQNRILTDLPREVQNYLGEWARKFLLNRKTINKRIDFKKDPFRGQFIAKKLKE